MSEGLQRIFAEQARQAQAMEHVVHQVASLSHGLEKLEANDYDNFRKRAYVSKMEKFTTLPSVWAKIQGMPKGRADSS